MPSRARFLQLYDALPPDAQHLLVHRHLVPLLDTVSKAAQKRSTATATDLLRRYARMPALNLKAKKAEIAALLLELSRDARRSLIKERSRREQLLAEAVDSLVQWLNDIWKVVFEFRTNFALAHACLLYARDALDQIGSGSGGQVSVPSPVPALSPPHSCGCSFASMFVPVKITRSSGKVVKSFTLNGAQNLETVMLWIWRDLFITLLATGSKRQRSTIPDMMDDIRVLLGWRALEQLLRGGCKRTSSDPFSPPSPSPLPAFDQEEPEVDEDERAPRDPEHTPSIVDDDGDHNYLSDDCSSICDEDPCPRIFYAPHWSWRIADQQSRLRNLVHTALLNIFKVAPSAPLYSSMIAIAEDEDDLDAELHPLVMAVAGHSSDNLSAALRIVSLNNRTDSVNKLLKAHKHLLRPQDAASLQFAVLIMSGNFFYRSHAMSIVQEELSDVSNVFRAAIRASFCKIDSEINKSELTQILALRRDSLHRRTRVERWVKGVLTPQVNTAHPMALAALMIGIPLPPGADGTDEGDMLGYVDLDGDDPDQEDLREEFRPNIKARFQGWVDTAVAVRGGSAMLMKMYTNLVGDMPFLKGKDVVEEMLARYAGAAPCNLD